MVIIWTNWPKMGCKQWSWSWP